MNLRNRIGLAVLMAAFLLVIKIVAGTYVPVKTGVVCEGNNTLLPDGTCWHND